MACKRRIYGTKLREQVALEAIGGELTVADLVVKQGVHQTLVNIWKRQALEGISKIFSGKSETPLNLALKTFIGGRFMEMPFYGSRQMAGACPTMATASGANAAGD